MFRGMLWIISLLVSMIFMGGCELAAYDGAALLEAGLGAAGDAVFGSSETAKKNLDKELNANFTPWKDTDQSVREIMDKNGKPEEEMLFQNEIPVKKILVYHRTLEEGSRIKLALFIFDSGKNQFVFLEMRWWEKDKYLTWIKDDKFKEFLKSEWYINVLNKQRDTYEKQGRYDLAFGIIKKLMEQKSEANPVNAKANNSVAWFFAACKDPRYRDAEKALEYAQKAVAIKRSASYLDTLSAACAEKGDFEKAVEVETEAYNLALDKNSGESLESLNSFKELIEVYRSHRTYAQWKYGEKLTVR